MSLADKKCVPCHGGIPPMDVEEAKKLKIEAPAWQLKDKSIEREFKFRNFREAIDFVNKVAEIAESEGHHPDININYNKVNMKLFTHAIDGLSESDFILAAKVDKMMEE